MQSLVHRFRRRLLSALDDGLLQKRAANRRYMRDEYWKKRRPINMALDEAGYRRIKKAADDAGYSPTAFARMAVLAYLEQRFLVPANLENALWEASREVRKIGNLLNQIARHANRSQRLPFLDLVQTRSLVRQMQARLEEIVRFPVRAA